MERTAKLLGVHLALLALLGLLCWYGCPFARLLGISCPGCGLTRAWLCFLQGRWQQAMAYHALFLPAPPFLLWVIHRNAVRQFPARPLLPFPVRKRRTRARFSPRPFPQKVPGRRELRERQASRYGPGARYARRELPPRGPFLPSEQRIPEGLPSRVPFPQELQCAFPPRALPPRREPPVRQARRQQTERPCPPRREEEQHPPHRDDDDGL